MSFSIIHGSEMNKNSKQVRIVANVIIFGKPATITIAKIYKGKIIPYAQGFSLSVIAIFLGELYTSFLACKLSKDLMELFNNSIDNVNLVKEIAKTGRINFIEFAQNN